MKISIEIPFFPGFYESDLENSDTPYWAIKNELEYYQDELSKDHPEYKTLTEDDLDFNYSDYEKDVAKSFLETWKSYAPKDIVGEVEFDEIVSPKYYNFSTDRMFATVELKEGWEGIMRAFMSENKEWLKKCIHDDWTSYDGFMSFMDNDINEWDAHLFAEHDARYISTMIGYIMYHENNNIRDELVVGTLEDIYDGEYVYITDEAKERMKEDIEEGRIVILDPDQLKIPFED